MIVPFTKTMSPLLRGEKRVTRRFWKQKTIDSWNRSLGKSHTAWSNIPRVKGAKVLANVRATQPAYTERLLDMPESHLTFEGGLWQTKQQFFSEFGEVDEATTVAVVHFELTQVVIPPIEQALIVFAEEELSVLRSWINGLDQEPRRALVEQVTAVYLAHGGLPKSHSGKSEGVVNSELFDFTNALFQVYKATYQMSRKRGLGHGRLFHWVNINYPNWMSGCLP